MYKITQFAISTKGLKSLARISVGLTIIAIYTAMVALFVSPIFIKASQIIFLSLLFSIAISSVPLEPFINTLVSSTDHASENSTIILSFKYIGGGVGYNLSSLMLGFR